MNQPSTISVLRPGGEDRYQQAINAFAEANRKYNLALEFLKRLSDDVRSECDQVGGGELIANKIDVFLSESR